MCQPGLLKESPLMCQSGSLEKSSLICWPSQAHWKNHISSADPARPAGRVGYVPQARLGSVQTSNMAFHGGSCLGCTLECFGHIYRLAINFSKLATGSFSQSVNFLPICLEKFVHSVVSSSTLSKKYTPPKKYSST